MIKVGLTGSIGSGKSLICQVFSILDVPVYNADIAAKVLTDEDADIRKELESLFKGMEIYTSSGLDRNKLAELIFNDENKLNRVNRIIHPRVIMNFIQWCNLYSKSDYIIHEAAILFESKAYKSFDKIITVTAPETIRLERILSREAMTQKKAGQIMNNQLPDDEKIKLSDYVIINDGNTLVIPQVLKIHAELKEIAQNPFNEKIR